MKKISHLLVMLVAAAITVLGTACSHSVGYSPTITVTPQKTASAISYAITSVSKTTTDAVFTNTLTNTGDGAVTYTSSKTDVATVNEIGKVTIVATGETIITATVADSDNCTYETKTASYTLTVTCIGTKAPAEPKEVGDIVFTDGSAMPYSAFAALDVTTKNTKKASAIALIFYKGKELNSGSDKTTIRVLGVGLKHGKSAWGSKSASARDNNIATIQCTASYEKPYTFTGDKNGSDNLEQIAAFLTAADGVDDDTATVANYPAFYFAKNYTTTATNIAGTAYENDWYLPSIAELFQIYVNGKGTAKVFDIDTASKALGGDSFGAEYWSSSQYYSGGGIHYAYTLRFSEGSWNFTKKDDASKFVRCVREF